MHFDCFWCCVVLWQSLASTSPADFEAQERVWESVWSGVERTEYVC
jgi:hypothetical protein